MKELRHLFNEHSYFESTMTLLPYQFLSRRSFNFVGSLSSRQLHFYKKKASTSITSKKVLFVWSICPTREGDVTIAVEALPILT